MSEVERAAEVMVNIGWRCDSLTQYCIRGIAEELDISVSRASKLYRKVLDSNIICQEKEVRQEVSDKHYLWGGFGKANVGYMRWVWSEEKST